MTHRLIALFIIHALSIHSINADSFQEKHMSADNQDNIVVTLQQQLRMPHYKKEVLPNDFSNLSELITFGTRNNQPPAYLRSVVKMFSNMLKSAHYVNAYAFSAL